MKHFPRLLFFLALLFAFGCKSKINPFRTDPAPPAGFIENPQDLREQRERAPFHRLWFKEQDEFYRKREEYSKIHFLPVRTDFLIRKGWWDDLNVVDQQTYDRDRSEMAQYIRKQFIENFQNDPNRRFLVVDTPDEQTIIYEIALVELVATKAHINAVGTALGFFVPGGGLVSMAGKGSIAIEVKAYDGKSGEVVVAWADREQDPGTLVSLNDFSFYSHARQTIKTWAMQLVEIYNTPMDHTVEDEIPFTLLPF